MANKYSTAYVAENVYTLRKNRLALSQEKFGERTNLSVETISNIERGRFCPNLQTLVSISNGTDTPIEYFVLENKG